MAKGKYLNQNSKQPRSGGIWIVIALLLIAIVALFIICLRGYLPFTGESTGHTSGTTAAQTTEQTTVSTTETTAPTEPYVVSTASIGVTGDVLMHSPVMNAARKSDGTYDFSDNYVFMQDYFNSFDFMIANLEVTLGGTEAGEYRGYPTFNCPDDVVDGLLVSGVDMLLTANNHTYDTGHNGFIRTQQVLDEKGMLHLGTRQSEEVKNYMVQDLNGIKVGMLCYTYETGDTSDGRKCLNGIPVSKDDTNLVNSFSYNDLEGFYSEVTTALASMDQEGADASIVFIHWGDEYQLSPNTHQTTIAQGLCDLGVDVIVGGHPHVIQPFETLTSETGHNTYCIYSVGNAMSNQRRDTLSTGNARYTEDGMVFGVSFEKWNDGSVNISEISILPTWVNKEWRNNKQNYNMIPLDTAVPVWDCYEVGNISNTYSSYERTMSIVGEGLNACRTAFGLEEMPLTFGAE